MNERTNEERITPFNGDINSIPRKLVVVIYLKEVRSTAKEIQNI